MSGIGCKDNHHLQHLGKSIVMYAGEPIGNGKEGEQMRMKMLMKSPMSLWAVRVAIVLGVGENPIHGEGPQPTGALDATALNVNMEVHP